MKRYDRSRFHFFLRADGSKRYYRTGQSFWKKKDENKNSLDLPLPWLADKKKDDNAPRWNFFQKPSS
jgi:hypothetical protein